MATNRLQQLQQLANQAPELENRALARGKDARTALLQQQLGALPNANLQQAQELQGQQTTIAGQQQVEAMKQSQQTASQLGQEAIQAKMSGQSAMLDRAEIGQAERQQAAKDQLAARLQQEAIESRKKVTQADIEANKLIQARGFEVDSRMQFASEQQRKDLNKLGNNIKQELLDSRIAFDKDEAGRKFSNDRQLADFAASEAKTQQEFEARMGSIANAARQNSILQESINNRLAEIVRQGYIETSGDLDNAQRVKLAGLQTEARKQAEKAKADAGNKLLTGQALGTLVGIGVAAMVPGGMAAAPMVLGATAGGAGGTILASNT